MKTQAKLTGKRCQCTVCHEYFSVVANFDKHRKGEHGINRACVDPSSVGLVVRTAGESTFWSMPGDNSESSNPESARG